MTFSVDTQLPDFAAELITALVKQGEPTLASQVGTLTIESFCRCGQENCATFFTGPMPDGRWGPGHRNVIVNASQGMVILDIVAGSIRMIEILDRSDVKALLPVLDPGAEHPG